MRKIIELFQSGRQYIKKHKPDDVWLISWLVELGVLITLDLIVWLWWLVRTPFGRWESKATTVGELDKIPDVPLPVRLVIKELMVRHPEHYRVHYTVHPYWQRYRDKWTFRTDSTDVMLVCIRERITDLDN
uniref:Uncharacterized protein n=1 Tax=Pseudomonas phage RVTF4 TaxID=3236931 RepID=A0AB39CCA7_9VIRU